MDGVRRAVDGNPKALDSEPIPSERRGTMSSVTNHITIQRPIEDVFTTLTDVENAGTWFPGDVEEHWTSPPCAWRRINAPRTLCERRAPKFKPDQRVARAFD